MSIEGPVSGPADQAPRPTPTLSLAQRQGALMNPFLVFAAFLLTSMAL